MSYVRRNRVRDLLFQVRRTLNLEAASGTSAFSEGMLATFGKLAKAIDELTDEVEQLENEADS